MDNSLIAGMPEVIAHIKKIEEENKKLRRELATMGEGEEAHLCMIAHLKREIEKLKKENKKLARMVADQTLKVCNLQVEVKELQKYAEIMGDIDGDQLTDLLKDCGWEYNDDLELVKVTD